MPFGKPDTCPLLVPLFVKPVRLQISKHLSSPDSCSGAGTEELEGLLEGRMKPTPV